MDFEQELKPLYGILNDTYGDCGKITDRDEPVVRMEALRKIIEECQVEKWIREGGLQGNKMAEFLPAYLKYTVKIQHPRNLNHQVSSPNPLSGIANLISGVSSNPMNIYEMGPAAAALEFFLVNYFLQIVGWAPQPYPDSSAHQEPSGGGLLTHGGTLANLNALVVAYSLALREGRITEEQRPVIFTSDCSHYSLEQAAYIMRADAVNVPTDEQGVMRLECLERMLKEYEGRVIATVASACNTPVGSFDNIRDLASLCRSHSVQTHVDGAHGGSLLMSKKYKHRLDGIELADTLTWDTHKLLRTSGVCTLLLAKDRSHLDLSLKRDASYLFHAKQQPGFDFMGRTLECTKSSLSLHLFHSLACEGEGALTRYVEQVCDLTHAAWDIFQRNGILCPVEPQCNILCFRPQNLSDENALLHLRDTLREEYNFFLSSTLYKGQRWLRLVIMSPLTTEADIEKLCRTLKSYPSG